MITQVLRVRAHFEAFICRDTGVCADRAEPYLVDYLPRWIDGFRESRA